jgi:hypothetical protein
MIVDCCDCVFNKLLYFCRFLQKRMAMLSTLKLNALTLDELYNSREIIITNIFHAALLQAFRFHSIVKNCFDRNNQNQGFLAQIVYTSAGKIGCEVLRINNKYCKGNLLRKFYNRNKPLLIQNQRCRLHS